MVIFHSYVKLPVSPYLTTITPWFRRLRWPQLGLPLRRAHRGHQPTHAKPALDQGAKGPWDIEKSMDPPFYSVNQRTFDWAIFNSFLFVYQRLSVIYIYISIVNIYIYIYIYAWRSSKIIEHHWRSHVFSPFEKWEVLFVFCLTLFGWEDIHVGTLQKCAKYTYSE